MLQCILNELNKEKIMIDKLKDKREDLAMRLENVIIDHPTSLAKLADDIGLAYNTLRSFVLGNRDTSMETLARIEKFIVEKEKE